MQSKKTKARLIQYGLFDSLESYFQQPSHYEFVQIDLFLEQAKGYVKALEKSTSRVFGLERGF